jgi:hypothetical protein
MNIMGKAFSIFGSVFVRKSVFVANILKNGHSARKDIFFKLVILAIKIRELGAYFKNVISP